ncbi:MAG: hypothetical protein LBJ23_04345 [Tannerella sp.]|jgi:hypothetical protein|nr:hypothetical protein [Tannerella sp.]
MRLWTSIYRRLFCCGGFGIHSPFVFDMITNVVGERCAYYFYGEMASARLQLSQNTTCITCGGRRTTVCRALRRYGISPKEGRLLFRIANRFKPRAILTVGSSQGMLPLCLTGSASSVQCITLEAERDFAEMATKLVGQKTQASVEIRHGEYEAQIIPALEKLGRVDCLCFGKEVDVQTQERIFARCVPFLYEQSICIVTDIHASSARKRRWKAFCLHPKVTVSLDLYTTGILFFHPRLNRRSYKSLVY